ncbi:MAG: hypothetical protein Kow0074_14600 [Candidatus Zixiibacteriota bacterium]
MTTRQQLIQKKVSLLELGEYLQNVPEAYRIHPQRRTPASTSTISRQPTCVEGWGGSVRRRGASRA